MYLVDNGQNGLTIQLAVPPVVVGLNPELKPVLESGV